jgi:HAD superfamily hydrolase (TIGR01490 family)
VKYRYERGEIGALEVLRGLGAYLQYKVGVLDIRTWSKGMMRELAGQSEADLAAEARLWFDSAVVPTIYPEAVELVRKHQAAGDVVAVVSGATKFVVQPLIERLGIEHMLTTRLEVEDGRFTGNVIEPLCFEEGKVHWLQKFNADHGIDLARSWFYTDSVTDLPLLDLVGHPVCVNPDPRLYRHAVRRRWPVRIFDMPR